MTKPASGASRFCLLLILALGCGGGEPTGPGPASFTVAVTGLPNGTPAAITVSGPGGFTQSVAATQTFSPVTPGTYSITAGNVTSGASEYSPSPPSQSVAVNGGQVTATVAYTVTTGSLAVTVSGLGPNSPAAVTVTGPGGYSRAITDSETLTALLPGTYSITAQDVAGACGTTFGPSPTSQDVTVLAQQVTNHTVSYQPPSAGDVNLCIDGLYLTQSTQRYSGAVPLVQNRNGYLRVFVVADRANTATPAVEVRIYDGLLLRSTITIPPTLLSVPTAADESSLSFTWDTTVAGTLIQPGLRIEAEVDPTNSVFESNESDNTLSVGPPAMMVRSVPSLDVTFVPILQSSLLGNVSEANKNTFLEATRRMHPIDGVQAQVGPVYTTTWSLGDNGAGWEELLFDFNNLVATDPQYCAAGRYCYGVVKVSYNSGVAGIAYVSQGSATARVALGWDYTPLNPMAEGSGGIVLAHELAHNWGRLHAPCGNPGSIDLGYPQADGSIGTYGFDVTTSTLKSSASSDIMGYCTSKWIGEYSYRGVMDYRAAHPVPVTSGAQQTVQPSLLVSGRISDDTLVLEPTFLVNTRPALPSQPGPYSIQGRADDGNVLFDLSFTPQRVADLPTEAHHFVFAVPMAPETAARVSSLRLSGRGRQLVKYAESGSKPDSLRALRTGAGGVSLRWNSRAHPVVLVRDAETGRVLSFARGGHVELPSMKSELDLHLSDGVKSRVRRIRVGR